MSRRVTDARRSHRDCAKNIPAGIGRQQLNRGQTIPTWSRQGCWNRCEQRQARPLRWRFIRELEHLVPKCHGKLASVQPLIEEALRVEREGGDVT